MRKFILLVSFMILQSVFVNADFKLYRETLAHGETVQLEFSLNNTARDITPLNINLYDPNNVRKSVSPFLKKVNDKYYLYFDLLSNLEDGLYDIVLKNISVYENGILKDKSYKINMSVKESQSKISINPAFIFLDKETTNFNLRVKSIGAINQIKIETSQLIDHTYSDPQTIQQSRERLFKFKVKPNFNIPEVNEIKITYGDRYYVIPLIFTSEISSEEILQIKPFEIISDTRSINKTIKRDQTISGLISIKNNLNTTLSLIYRFTGNIKDISAVEISNNLIPPNSTADLNLIINGNKSSSLNEYSGNLELEALQNKEIIPIFVRFIEEPSIEEDEIVIPKEEKPKEEEEEVFDLNYTAPQQQPKRSKQTWFIVLAIILIIAAVIYYLSKKKSVQQKEFSEYVGGIEKR